MTKQIPLRNKARETVAYVTVDDADFDWINRHSWYLDPRHGFARRQVRVGGVPTYESVARVVAGAVRHDGNEVRHINGDRLDCRRTNLLLTRPNTGARGKDRLTVEEARARTLAKIAAKTGRRRERVGDDAAVEVEA